ncbi:uncharacterized protein LOC113872117 [Abrus precatorius]|uniref:Uncharacterized protein LOC113872117 n=1 Tax=Abrus precatorius TaxID=3816 RepID=A0A8B8M931_ABRPR|nr:uncharacterized protein LOC113872117 [Abrus precatorius]
MSVVLDISSDEEEDLEKGLKKNDFDWIKEFLFTSDDEESDDSDEVVIIRENKPESKSKSSTLVVKDVVVDDDDDCVVLEGDPQNGVASVVEETTESDELLVVGEKGQIACRDYPHARHLCAKFPFSSTPHERHCSQCHCYVCDSLAPCLRWGTGILSSDHCHANDKTELWKIQRKNFRLGQSSPLPASANHGTSLRAVHPQHDEFLHVDITHLSPNSVLQNQASRPAAMRTFPALNSLPQIQASRPTTMRTLTPSLNSSVQNQASRPVNIPVMSTATNLAIPNDANRGRCRESGSTLVRNRYQPHSLPRPVLGVRSHVIQRERGNCASSLRPQLLRPHTTSKGLGSAGDTLTMNNSSHASSGFSNRINATQQRNKYHTATGFSNYRNHNGPNDVCHPINLSLYSPPSSEPANLSCVDKHTVASEMQAYSQPLPQSNDSQNFHQTSIQGNDDAPSSYATCLNPKSNQPGNEPQIRILNENANRNITQCGIASQDTCQPKPHEESPSEAARRFPAFDSIWKHYTDESIGPQIECSLQNSGSIDQQAPNAKESRTQFSGSNEHVTECSQLSTPLLDFENWLLDKDCGPMVTDGVLPSDLSIPSPDLDPVDMGMMLFYLDQGV